jgi:predicted nucleic acid-binding protein
VATAVVVDASPLIALQQIGELSLLQRLFDRVLTPPGVALEVRPSLPELPVWLEVQAPAPSQDARIEAAVLGAGESEAIALALAVRPDWIILDDLAARTLARRLDLPVLGTAAVLSEAKTQGLIPAVRPLLDALLAKGFHLSRGVYQHILELAGENE